jgi:hypothetical protein
VISIPPQSPPIDRQHLSGNDSGPAEGEPAYMQAWGGVHASQSWCDRLTGPAKSLCYAAEYGVSV